MVSPPQVGQMICLRSWHGVVLDVFTNEVGKTNLRVQTVRNVFRRLIRNSSSSTGPGSDRNRQLGRLEAEVASYEPVLQQSIRELVGHVRSNGGGDFQPSM